jgi:hypothetical protein
MSFHNIPIVLEPAGSIRDDMSSESGCPVCSHLYKSRNGNTSVLRVKLEEAVQVGCPTCYIISERAGRVLSSVGLEEKLQTRKTYPITESDSNALVSCCETEDSYLETPRLALVGFTSIKGSK